MDNRKFNPRVDLPHCDICDATMIKMETQFVRDRTTSLDYRVEFACGSVWNTSRKGCFRATTGTMPDGLFTPWSEGAPMDYTESKTCPNAARFLRQARMDAE